MSNTDPIAAFDGRTISYAYDNGWSFTNTFDGHLRHSSVPRGDLLEHVEIAKIRDGIHLVSWVDDGMGLVAQVIDERSGLVFAAIPNSDESGIEILRGRLIDT